MKARCLSLAVALFLSFPVVALERLTYYTEDYPPFNYGLGGKLEGYSVELLEAIFSEAGVELDRNDVRLVPWARGYYAALNQPNTVLFSTTRTPARESLFQWVGPISPDRVVLLAHRDHQKPLHDLADLSDHQRHVVVIRDDIGAQRLLEEGVPEDRLHYAINNSSALAMLAAGRIDYWAYGESVAQWLMEQQGFDVADFVPLYTLNEAELYFALHPETEEELVQRMQSALDSVRAKGLFPLRTFDD